MAKVELRHTTGSLLAASGAHPKVAQQIMRHSTIELTLGRYSHIFRGQESAALAGLPDLSQPSREKQRAVATGTNGMENISIDTQNNLAQNLALLCGKQCISADCNGQKKQQNDNGERYKESPLLNEKSCFSVSKTDILTSDARSSAG